MDVISKALNEISFRIPKSILQATFLSAAPGLFIQNTSVEDQMMSLVIRPRVIVDLNLSGAVEVTIDISKISFEEPQQYIRIYRIPKALTNGRSIISALNITYSDPTRASTFASNTFQGNSPFLRAGQAVVDAAGPLPITSSHHVQLIAENTIMVKDLLISNTSVYMRCTVEHDPNFSTINPASYQYFCKAFEYAIKSYIWNTMIVRIDQNEIYAGQPLGVFKSIVEGYAECEELYQTHMNDVMAKVLYMNDHTRYNRAIRLILGGNR